MPAILAFDSSAAHCAAALLLPDGTVLQRLEPMEKGQAERLVPFLQELLAAGGLDWSDLAALAVGTGPGNFTGIRIACPSDMAAHAHGWESREWTAALETTDSAVRELVAALGPRAGLLVTADHGITDVPTRSHVLIDSAPALLDGIRFVAGEPRCLQLHFEPDLSATLRAALVDQWRAAESDRSWVLTRDEFVQSGWLGAVRPDVAPRIGDIIVAARKSIAYYDPRTASPHARAMIGQHGSATQPELRVPLLLFGAFAA